jgi:hypothetical protein
MSWLVGVEHRRAHGSSHVGASPVPDFELIRYVDPKTELITACGSCDHEAGLDAQEMVDTYGPILLFFLSGLRAFATVSGNSRG